MVRRSSLSSLLPQSKGHFDPSISAVAARSHGKDIAQTNEAQGSPRRTAGDRVWRHVDAITRITDDTVYVNQTRQHITGAPPYDPDLIHRDVGQGSYYGDMYRYYNYPPYWGPGYTYPPYPYYP